MKLYFTNQTIDRHKARDIELKIEQATGIELDNPFYDGDAKEAKELDGTGKSNLSSEEIVGRDIKKIREADGILALYTHDRNIGSTMEVAIAAFAWGKPVYIISNMPHVANHPWIKYFGVTVFDTPYDFIKWYVEKHNKIAQRKGWLNWVSKQLNLNQ